MTENITIKPNNADLRLDRFLRETYPALTQGMIQKWLRTGQIRVNGKRVEANYRTRASDILRLPPQLNQIKDTQKPKRIYTISEDDERMLRRMIIHEDENVFVINKPAGLAVQGGSKTYKHLDQLLGALADENGEKPRLVHRLDKETSGVMILAKNRQTASKIGLMFKTRQVKKLYVAIIQGVPEIHDGTIKAPLNKLPSYKGEQMALDEEGGKPAVTDYEILDHAGKAASLAALWPRTGRTHQLRVHTALMETPILGDDKYGTGEIPEDVPEQLYLHALGLSLPYGKFTAPLPDYFKKALKHYGLITTLPKDLMERS